MDAQIQAAEEELSGLADELEAWLRLSALPVWWSVGANLTQGGYHEALDGAGRPVDRPRRARVQTRQTYVYAEAAHRRWSGPGAYAVEHGLRFFIDRFQRSDGLYRASVAAADGAVVDDTAQLYDQAFAMFAFAAAYRVVEAKDEIATRARAVRARLKSDRAHAAGGYVEHGGQSPFASNPHMHLLEAALAWEETAPDPEWRTFSDDIVELALSRLIDAETGQLYEYFDETWTPIAAMGGPVFEPGHQFEWAWLLERWGHLHKRNDAKVAVRRLFEAGCRGVDTKRNVAMDVLSRDWTPVKTTARLWPQTERMKIALVLCEGAAPADRVAYLREAIAATRGLMQYLDNPLPALWRDKLSVDGSFLDEPAPATSLYHIAVAVLELVRVAKGFARQSAQRRA